MLWMTSCIQLVAMIAIDGLGNIFVVVTTVKCHVDLLELLI